MSEFVMVKRELLERVSTPCMGEGARNLREGDIAELRAVLAQEAGKVEPIPITEGTDRLMEAYRLGEFRLEGGSPTVEAMSCASFDENPNAVRDCDFDSYAIGYQSAMYEEAKSLLGLIASTPAPVSVVVVKDEYGQTVISSGWCETCDGMTAHETRCVGCSVMQDTRSVVLPEREESPNEQVQFFPNHDFDWQDGWNACLDKVKELNQ